MRKDLIFQILAAVFLVVAAYFFWGQNNDLAFFFLVLSASSFLLNIRFQAKARLSASERSDLDKSPTDS
jgi:hypothetical protein